MSWSSTSQLGIADASNEHLQAETHTAAGVLFAFQASAPSGALLPAIGPRLSCAQDGTPEFWHTRSGTSGRELHDHSLLVGRHASQALRSLSVLKDSLRMCESSTTTCLTCQWVAACREVRECPGFLTTIAVARNVSTSWAGKSPEPKGSRRNGRHEFDAIGYDVTCLGSKGGDAAGPIQGISCLAPRNAQTQTWEQNLPELARAHQARCRQILGSSLPSKGDSLSEQSREPRGSVQSTTCSCLICHCQAMFFDL